jgi:5-methylcytosine-specific restriction endonuclease McrA
MAKEKTVAMEKYKVIDGVKHKLCSTCKEYIPVDQFSTRAASPDGLAYSCKTCERATAAASYARKKKRNQSKKYYQENKEACNDRAKARYAANSASILAQQAIWRESKTGKAVMAAAAKRRRERIKTQTPDGADYTRLDVVERDTFGGKCICQICGEPILDLDSDLQIDHIIPIAEGGADNFKNVRCSHKICNLKRPKDGKDLK